MVRHCVSDVLPSITWIRCPMICTLVSAIRTRVALPDASPFTKFMPTTERTIDPASAAVWNSLG